jgi:hypothetical protein
MKKLWILEKPGDCLNVWACSPDGCGRIFLESQDGSTWYLPEQNHKRKILSK